MDKNLKDEFEFYKNNQNKLVKKYKGRYIVIVGNDVIGDYATQEEAITQTLKTHALGTFLVHLVGSGEENYTQTFHSRVAHASLSR